MSELYNQQPRELNWDDPINSEEIERPRLSPGDYPFQIVSMEKQRHSPEGNHPVPPCNKAYLTVRVTDRSNGLSVDIHHSLYLHSVRTWQLCQFFAAIGLLQKGEELKMDWSHVVGATGICKIKPWQTNDGRTLSIIDRFYPAYDLPAGAAPQQSYQQPAQSYAAPVAPMTYGQPQQGYASPQQPNNGNSFTPGRF